jgi:hypothetical protein
MNVLSKLLFRTVNIQQYKSVREDFLRAYRAALDIPEIRSRARQSNSELRNGAKECWRTAPKFDPHSSIHQPLETISGVHKFLWAVLAVLFLISVPLSIGVGEVFSSYLTAVANLPRVILAWLPSEVVVAIGLYLYLLGQDTDLIQRLNRQLRITPGRIEGTRTREELFSFYIWNSSLHNSKKIPVLASLVLLQSLSTVIYNRVMNSLARNADILHESDGFLNTFRSLFRAEIRDFSQ